MNILLLPFAPISSAGARYRIYKVAPYLKAAGHTCLISPPVPDKVFELFYTALFASPRGAIYGLEANLLRRIYYAIVRANRRREIKRWSEWADLAIVQRELYKPGDLELEALLRSRVRRLIWDFDDALYAAADFGKSGHVDKIIAMSDAVIAGNEGLAEHARKAGKPVMVMPTCIDQESCVPKDNSAGSENVIIGWTGNPFNLRHFGLILPALQRISAKYPQVIVRLNSRGQKPVLPGVRTEYRGWTLENEMTDLTNFDVGIMPLIDDAYTRGKCGFKLLQYMAAGLPSVSSPVGVNARIVDDGENGFLARSNDDWANKLSLLIENPELRKSMGIKARRKALREYSLAANAGKLVAFIEGVANN